VFVAPPGVEQYQALLQLYDENEQFRMLYDAIGNIAVLEWYLNPYDKPRCELGQNPYLTAAGRLYPCLMCHCDDYSVTGVFETSIKQALNAAEPKWRALRQISLERAASIAQCRSCELRGSCGGGCVGRAWGSYEDLFSPDDRCSLRRAVLAWTQKTTSLQDFCS
jgi:radical SAM protein with 4Fe4S-binding SPASM domain